VVKWCWLAKTALGASNVSACVVLMGLVCVNYCFRSVPLQIRGRLFPFMSVDDRAFSTLSLVLGFRLIHCRKRLPFYFARRSGLRHSRTTCQAATTLYTPYKHAYHKTAYKQAKMGEFIRAFQASVQGHSFPQAAGTLLYALALLLAGVWTLQQVWFSFPATVPDVSVVPWELFCMADEVVGRKCVLAVGGLVHQGRYLVALGGTTVGVISIGQVAIGVISLGWLACGVLLSAGITAVACPGLVAGLVSFGGHSPGCVVGLTLIKTPRSQGVLNFAPLHLPAAFLVPPGGGGIGGRGSKKIKESPRVEMEEDEEEARALRRHQQQHQQQQVAGGEEWPHTHRHSRYAQGA